MIVSNPPYIRTNMISILQEEVKDHEPLSRAGRRSATGLDFYRTIVDEGGRPSEAGGLPARGDRPRPGRGSAQNAEGFGKIFAGGGN